MGRLEFSGGEGAFPLVSPTCRHSTLAIKKQRTDNTITASKNIVRNILIGMLSIVTLILKKNVASSTVSETMILIIGDL